MVGRQHSSETDADGANGQGVEVSTELGKKKLANGDGSR
jgi:hypothetical protein